MGNDFHGVAGGLWLLQFRIYLFLGLTRWQGLLFEVSLEEFADAYKFLIVKVLLLVYLVVFYGSINDPRALLADGFLLLFHFPFVFQHLPL